MLGGGANDDDAARCGTGGYGSRSKYREVKEEDRDVGVKIPEGWLWWTTSGDSPGAGLNLDLDIGGTGERKGPVVAIREISLEDEDKDGDRGDDDKNDGDGGEGGAETEARGRSPAPSTVGIFGILRRGGQDRNRSDWERYKKYYSSSEGDEDGSARRDRYEVGVVDEGGDGGRRRKERGDPLGCNEDFIEAWRGRPPLVPGGGIDIVSAAATGVVGDEENGGGGGGSGSGNTGGGRGRNDCGDNDWEMDYTPPGEKMISKNNVRWREGDDSIIGGDDGRGGNDDNEDWEIGYMSPGEKIRRLRTELYQMGGTRTATNHDGLRDQGEQRLRGAAPVLKRGYSTSDVVVGLREGGGCKSWGMCLEDDDDNGSYNSVRNRHRGDRSEYEEAGNDRGGGAPAYGSEDWEDGDGAVAAVASRCAEGERSEEAPPPHGDYDRLILYGEWGAPSAPAFAPPQPPRARLISSDDLSQFSAASSYFSQISSAAEENESDLQLLVRVYMRSLKTAASSMPDLFECSSWEKRR